MMLDAVRSRDWVVRPVAEPDLPALLEFAASLGSGMTTMPADEAVLAAKIATSVASFAGTAEAGSDAFLLVLEELLSGAILGTSAVYAHVGFPDGFYSYKRLRLLHRSRSLGLAKSHDQLVLTNEFTGATEVGSLAVRPEYQGSGASRLLARARYLLIATAPERFAEVIMAELRGYQDADGRNAFWDAVGSHFFDMEFAQASYLSATRGNEFIAELMPRAALYLALLPSAAVEVIGRPHPNSAPALHLLRQEGFAHHGYVDVFDAGPQVSVNRDDLATVRLSQVLSWREGHLQEGPVLLVANNDLQRFRVIAATGTPAETLTLSGSEVARLQLDPADRVRVVPVA